MVNGAGVDEEHADGEGSPSGEQRRRQNNTRPRRRMRDRRRTSERQNSEGEAPHERDELEQDGGEVRRRRPRRPRRPRNEQVSGDDGEMQDGKMSPEVRGDGRRRPRRNRRPRNRSEGDREDGDRGEEGDRTQHDSEHQDRRPPPRRFTNRRRPRNDSRREGGEQSGDSPTRDGAGSPGGYRRLRRMNNLPSVYIGSLPKALRVSDFKRQVRDKDVNPLRVLWRGTNGHVFIMFQTMDETEDALRKLENLSINEKEVKVALANRTERRIKEGTPEGDARDDDIRNNYSTGSGDNRMDSVPHDSLVTS